jgi:nucleoside-diphosphate-sugar epimerase
MKTTLVTGASGEMGHALLEVFAADPTRRVIAADLSPIPAEQAKLCAAVVQGDIADPAVVAQLEQHDIQEVYHLAALLSTSAEKNPELAQHVNVNGTMGLLSMARRIGARTGSVVTFIFPSTIAVYGLPSVDAKNAAGAVTEDQALTPTTMYGINKLYCESLGAYMSDRYGQLLQEPLTPVLDFRALRFPGLISAFTVPSGGTSDYAPEMIHAAAKGEPYACFVRPDTRIPFMAMPDGVRALLMLAAAPKERLTRRVYNIGAFAPSAEEIAAKVKSAFPNANVTYAPHPKRQAIVDSWCADVNDAAARTDWGWSAEYDMDRAFNEYLIPNIAGVYA